VVRLTRDGYYKQRPAWAPGGEQIVFTRHRGGKIGLATVAADGSGEILLSQGKFPQYDACWSPDGKRLAFTHVAQSGPQGNLDIFTSRPDLSDMVRVAGDRRKLSHEESPAWSPDGASIAFSSTCEGNQELFVVALDGASARRLTNDPAIDAHPAWSADGKKLAFATNRWGDFEVALIDVATGQVSRMTESRGLDDYPAFDRQGHWLAFTSNRDGNFEIYVMPAAGGAARNITRNPALDHYAAWSPDGRLTFVSNRDDAFDLYILRDPSGDNEG
jgi:TolB protein